MNFANLKKRLLKFVVEIKMRKYPLSLTVLSLLALTGFISTSCTRGADSAPITLTQKNRADLPETTPIVAITPVIDSSGAPFPWDLSQEFTQELFNRLARDEKLQLTIRANPPEGRPFGDDLAWMKNHFPGIHFAIFVEISQHEETQDPKTSFVAFENLDLTARIRVVDLRKESPKIVLQEVVEVSETLSKEYASSNIMNVSNDYASFSMTPIGLSHQKVVKELAKRAEEYILIASQR